MNSNSSMPTKSVQGILNRLKAEAMRLGFSACGVARAEMIGTDNAEAFRRWISEGKNAGMDYMCNYETLRMDPCVLLPGARSVISVALNYYPKQFIDASQPQFAFYAYGKDYHDVMRERLNMLAEWLKIDVDSNNTNGNTDYDIPTYESPMFRVCVDTAPVLERYWAQQSGIGWIGRNHSLIIPHAGSYFFLGEIITSVEFDYYDTPIPSQCGNCHRCLDVCPAKALGETLDARRCLSYLTIEHRGDFTDEMLQILSSSLSRSSSTTDSCESPKSQLCSVTNSCESPKSQLCYIYGCDRCQHVCPHNRFATPTEIAEFMPSDSLLSMRYADWKSLTRSQYQELFRGSAVKRVKYEGLMRNINELLK